MKVFVTTGTTDFTELVEAVLTLSDDYEIVVQTPTAYKNTDNCCFIGFVKNIADYYQWADIIITHAGAGSVYKLLELERKILVVPNLTRNDKHQSQLANYVRDYNYGGVCYDLNTLESELKVCRFSCYYIYKNQSFSGINNILDLFELKYV
jgi:beta-1,4-N-acetylglucosaminyltransferase